MSLILGAAHEALDLDFLHRVYRTTAILVVLGTALLWEQLGSRAALGLFAGSSPSLALLRLLEWAVRRHTRAGGGSTLLLVSLAKLVGAAAALVLLFVAALGGWVNLLWVLPGFALPHLVLLLKLLGRKVLSLQRMPDDRGR